MPTDFVIRFCASCYEQCGIVSQVILYNEKEDLHHCSKCNSNIESYQTYTHKEMMRELSSFFWPEKKP